MEEKARHMCWSSGRFCQAFHSAQEAFLEPGVFNLLQASTLALAGGWVSVESDVLTDCLLPLGLYLQAVWEQLVQRACLFPSSPVTWIISKTGPRPSGRSNVLCGPCCFPGPLPCPSGTSSRHLLTPGSRNSAHRGNKEMVWTNPSLALSN